MTIKERILQIAKKKGVTNQKICNKIGLTYGNFTGENKKRPINSDAIANLLSEYPDINPTWLLTGMGSMLRDTRSDAIHIYNKEENSIEAVPIKFAPNKENKPIPLVNISAAAGFGSDNFLIAEQDVKEYYIVPKFKYLKVDFMIEIHGSSMYPKYNSGDIVACTILHDRRFIQWNKCHVIATREQGLICKRLLESKRENCLSAVSDNRQYPPFDIPTDEITGIALVVGVIRLE